MAKRGPGNPYHDPKTGEFTSGRSATFSSRRHPGDTPEISADTHTKGGTLRYSQLSKRERAKLRTSAQVQSTFNNTGQVTGTKVRKIPQFFAESTPHAHAVALKTARELDKDFHRNKDKKAQADMHEAIKKFTGRVTKLPPGKVKK